MKFLLHLGFYSILHYSSTADSAIHDGNVNFQSRKASLNNDMYVSYRQFVRALGDEETQNTGEKDSLENLRVIGRKRISAGLKKWARDKGLCAEYLTEPPELKFKSTEDKTKCWELVFKKFDADSSGKLGEAELKKFLTDVMGPENGTDERVKQLLTLFDDSKDKSLDDEEFKQYVLEVMYKC